MPVLSMFLLAPGLSSAVAAGLPEEPSQRIELDSSTLPGAFGGGFDLQGDGYDDIVTATASGVLLYEGGASGFSPRTRSLSSPTGSATGVVAVGDVNGDGVDDLLLCDSEGSSGAGASWLLLGSATSPATRTAVRYGGSTSAALGTACGALGDVNGDGYDDYGVSSVLSSTRDVVRIHAGGLTPGATLSTLSRIGKVTPTYVHLGGNSGSVEGIGDVNGDGYDDIAIGATLVDTTDDRVLIYHGGPTGPTEPATVTVMAPWAHGGNGGGQSHFGRSIAPGGDINGDGYDDMLVTAFGEAYYYGTIYVFWGSADGIHADDYVTTMGAYDSGAYSVWGDATFDGSPGNDLMVMGYRSIQIYSADESGFTLLDGYRGAAADGMTFMEPIYSAYARDVNGDGCHDAFTFLAAIDHAGGAHTFLGLFEGDCS